MPELLRKEPLLNPRLKKRNNLMTEQAYKEQIDAIKKVSKEARKSRESAIKFLVDAGIIKAKSVSKKKK